MGNVCCNNPHQQKVTLMPLSHGNRFLNKQEIFSLNQTKKWKISLPPKTLDELLQFYQMRALQQREDPEQMYTKCDCEELECQYQSPERLKHKEFVMSSHMSNLHDQSREQGDVEVTNSN